MSAAASSSSCSGSAKQSVGVLILHLHADSSSLETGFESKVRTKLEGIIQLPHDLTRWPEIAWAAYAVGHESEQMLHKWTVDSIEDSKPAVKASFLRWQKDGCPSSSLESSPPPSFLPVISFQCEAHAIVDTLQRDYFPYFSEPTCLLFVSHGGFANLKVSGVPADVPDPESERIKVRMWALRSALQLFTVLPVVIFVSCLSGRARLGEGNLLFPLYPDTLFVTFDTLILSKLLLKSGLVPLLHGIALLDQAPGWMPSSNASKRRSLQLLYLSLLVSKANCSSLLAYNARDLTAESTFTSGRVSRFLDEMETAYRADLTRKLMLEHLFSFSMYYMLTCGPEQHPLTIKNIFDRFDSYRASDSAAAFADRLSAFLPALLQAFAISNIEQFLSKLLAKSERTEWEHDHANHVPFTHRSGSSLLLTLYYDLSAGCPALADVVPIVVRNILRRLPLTLRTDKATAASIQRRFELRQCTLPTAAQHNFWTHELTAIAALKFSRDGRQNDPAFTLHRRTLQSSEFANQQRKMNWFTAEFVVHDPYKVIAKQEADAGWAALQQHFPHTAAASSASAAASSSSSAAMMHAS